MLPLLVKINAKGEAINLGLSGRVMEFSYEDLQEGDDMLRATFSDPIMELVDSEQFVENTEWTVQWGFPNNLQPARKVIVKRPSYRWGEVSVEALDKGVNLKVSENWEVYKNKTPKQIVEQIAEKNSLESDVDPELDNYTIETLPYGGRTDYEILKYLRSRSPDHYFKITENKIEFKKRSLDNPPVASFEYRPGRNSRILSFEFKVQDQDTAKSGKQTTGVSIDPETFRKLVLKSDEGTTTTTNLGDKRVNDTLKVDYAGSISSSNTNGGTAAKPNQGFSSGKILALPPKKPQELEAIAKSKRNKSILKSIELQLEVLASPDDPFLKSGDVIQILGIGRRYSGNYYIIDITHDLSSGYIYRITANSNALAGSKRSRKLNGKKNKKSNIGNKEAFKRRVLGSQSGGVVQ